jgi:Flp pilus assembly protein TadG
MSHRTVERCTSSNTVETQTQNKPNRTEDARTSRSVRGESGVAIVEFALVLPILMLIIVAIFDFGRALNYWADTTHLSAEGARLAAVDRIPDGTSLQAYIREEADSPELRGDVASESVPDPIEVCVTPDGDEVGDPVEVSVSTTYHWISFLGIGAPTTITGTATMRRERVADIVDPGCE